MIRHFHRLLDRVSCISQMIGDLATWLSIMQPRHPRDDLEHATHALNGAAVIDFNQRHVAELLDRIEGNGVRTVIVGEPPASPASS